MNEEEDTHAQDQTAQASDKVRSSHAEHEIASAKETIACMITTAPPIHRFDECCTHDGMIKLECVHQLPLLSAACKSTIVKCMQVTRGLVNGTTASILRDSGCSGVVIRTDLVHPK